MTEELHTTTCESCGWPALVGTRRCPYCRTTFPRPKLTMLRTGAASDPLNGLALAWVASMIPVTLLILATLGLSFALAMLAVSFLPAAGVWVFHRRVAARVGRFGRRRARGAQGTAGLHGSTTEPGNTSSDARSR